MKIKIIVGLSFFFAANCGFTQDLPIGKFSGSLVAQGTGRVQQFGISVDITSAENGNLKGTLQNVGQICGGIFPMEGTLDGKNIKFRSTETRNVPSCKTLQFQGTVNGNSLVGKMVYNGEPRELVLSK